jgi:hypothetical protein
MFTEKSPISKRSVGGRGSLHTQSSQLDKNLEEGARNFVTKPQTVPHVNL